MTSFLDSPFWQRWPPSGAGQCRACRRRRCCCLIRTCCWGLLVSTERRRRRGKEGEKRGCDLSKRILEKIKNSEDESPFILFFRLPREKESDFGALFRVRIELKLLTKIWKKFFWRQFVIGHGGRRQGKCWGSLWLMNSSLLRYLSLNLKKKSDLINQNSKRQKSTDELNWALLLKCWISDWKIFETKQSLFNSTSKYNQEKGSFWVKKLMAFMEEIICNKMVT